MQRIVHSVNALLDRRKADTSNHTATLPEQGRAVALYLMDRHKQPILVLTRQGSIALANASGLRLLSSPLGASIRQEMAARVQGRPSSREDLEAVHIPSSDLWFCSLATL